ncbi:MAG: ParA family protein, partial [Verrucomicrobia bacterium]
CPAHLELTKLDTLLGKGVNVITRLRVALRQPDQAPGPVVIDTCPLLGVLSLNAIFACDLLLIPVSADYLALQGAQQVERALHALEPVFKRRLPRRYVLTRFDARRKMSSEVADLMAMAFRAEEICATRIAENVSLAESPAHHLDVFRHAPQSRGARDYQELVDELVLEIERVVAEAHGLALAMDDFAVVIHLAQPAFGVGLVARHDAYVVDPLAGSRSDIEAVSDHICPPTPISPFFRAAHCGRSHGASGA